MDKLFGFFIIYFTAISVITAFITALDKILAKKKARRISEATLFTLAIIGGALSEYIVMKAIHHKTLHKKFMTGLPIIIVLQIICLGAFVYFL